MDKKSYHNTINNPSVAPTSDKIDFEKYDDIPVEASGRDCPEFISSWKEVDLGHEIQRNIEVAKYSKPTPVQRYSLPIVIAGRDLMSCAQTGSGKTAAFLVPIISQLLKLTRRFNQDRSKIAPLALVLAPTRELACQIHEEARKFSNSTYLKTAILYGGVSIRDQCKDLFRGADILVATPGRLADIIDRGKVTLSQIRFLVLDEADRMLDMGFEPQIRQIVEQRDMPQTGARQTLMFSATFAKEMQLLAASFLHDYIFLTIGRVGSTTELVTQKFIKVNDESDKEVKLLELVGSIKGLTIIFVETKKKASQIDYFLRKRGFPATSIHGDRDQYSRTAALKSFSTGMTPFLIATNVAARGLDISNIAHVINYDMPNNVDDYVHRIGRTGRAGKNGISTAFISEDNSGIAENLLEVLREANQEVPLWLESMAYRGGKRLNKSHSGRGFKFGGRDFRPHGNPPRTSHGSQYHPQQYPSGHSNPFPNSFGNYSSTAPSPYSNNGYMNSSYPPYPNSGPSYPAPGSWNKVENNNPFDHKRKPDDSFDSYEYPKDKFRKVGNGKTFGRDFPSSKPNNYNNYQPNGQSSSDGR